MLRAPRASSVMLLWSPQESEGSLVATTHVTPFPLVPVPQTRQRMKLIDSLSLRYSIMRLSCNRPKSSKTAGVQVFVTLSKSTPHMRPQATKSSGNTPNTTSFMEKFFRALCFMLTSSLEKSWYEHKKIQEQGIQWPPAIHLLDALAEGTHHFMGTVVLTKNYFLKTMPTNLTYHQNIFYCKEKHLKGPDSLGTKCSSHVLLMCIFSASQAEWRL